MSRTLFIGVCAVAFALAVGSAQGAEAGRAGFCAADPARLVPDQPDPARRLVCAEVAALEQPLVYNRFGAHDPFGMIFALTRDLVPITQPATAPEDLAARCDGEIGIASVPAGLAPGAARLRDCKRPRPLTLRANVGDVLMVRLHNYLRPGQPGYSETFCRQGGETAGGWRAALRERVSEGDTGDLSARPEDRLVRALCEQASKDKPAEAARDLSDWPATRGISFVIDGLRPLPDPGTGQVSDVCLGLGQLPPGAEPVDCYWHVEREGPYFINSIAAASGGEGEGGSLTHGLFGSLTVEPGAVGDAPTQWYRGQTSRAAFDRAWEPNTATDLPHDRIDALHYEATATTPEGETLPVLNLLKQRDGQRFELVHNELNAVIRPAEAAPFREFTVVFHDELKTFHTRAFEELDRFPQFKGVRDGFGINYGSSGLGALLLANRKGIGPAADCAECLYEEFFLESWANGDPALLEGYVDDPSNVHHSYLNDPVVFRNFHAGPKETHVFHLHAHQWFGGNDGGRGVYLDSQTVAPRQGFTYRIYGGGLGAYEGEGRPSAPMGSGNRNRTVGDSIFHCHLYPHFAQGMWELWRVHDVLEDGSRRLPDGQAHAGLSTGPASGGAAPRPGSVSPEGGFLPDAPGTPIPAVIPLPDQPAPVTPSYVKPGGAPGQWAARAEEAVPGYPFFIAGRPGHRAPQAPLDIARGPAGELLDGGLQRHVVLGGSERALGVTAPEDAAATEDGLYRLTAKMLALGDFSGHLTKADIAVLDQDGEPLERAAMGFHHDGTATPRPPRGAAPAPVDLVTLRPDGARAVFANGGYATPAPDGSDRGVFAVNGAPPKPGAPFADPCGAPDAMTGRSYRDPLGGETRAAAPRPDPFAGGAFVPDPALTDFRRYEVSAVQVDIVVNKAGWHDPQGRINVLTAASDRYKTLGPSAREVPFFFRATSGECVEFRHTNELPKELELDDFQMRTPTDTIGQHIHLVKFDVTSADGSGNGWNYEDGTFAADELASRLCAMLDPASAAPKVGAGSRGWQETNVARMTPEGWNALCLREGGHWAPRRGDWWQAKLSENRERFQTTVQRWFADPVLSLTGPGGGLADRTLRTVFTHDHFGPSSIQQHGFYSALVIEPAGKTVKPGLAGEDTPDYETAVGPGGFIAGGPGGVGVHKIVTDADPSKADPIHPDYREFALAIADFALLYDPTDGSTDDLAAAQGPISDTAQLEPPAEAPEKPSPKGIATLVCEAALRSEADPEALERRCGAHLTFDAQRRLVEDADVPPARVAGGWITEPEVTALRRHFALVRFRAGFGAGLARPVNAPDRPEAISADHHDPYLVNYRGEPIPLRIGDTGAPEATEAGETPEGPRTAFDCFAEANEGLLGQSRHRAPAAAEPAADEAIPRPGADATGGAALEAEMAAAATPDCSIDHQSPDPRGDLAHVYRSGFGLDTTGDGALANRAHGDPATPLLEAFSGERVQIRLIQGAQEVQHTFTIEGLQWRRLIDQRFPSEATPLATDFARPTWWRTCRNENLGGDAAMHDRWRDGTLPDDLPPAEAAYWADHAKAVAACDNLEGFVAAQEVGISEHFEIGAVPSRDNSEYRLTLAGATAETDPAKPLDYLYHFGSQDAVWNGAWGLMRVHKPGSNVQDETRRIEEGCDARGCPIAAALRPVDAGEAQARAAKGPGERKKTVLAPETLPAARRPAEPAACPLGAPVISAYAVAMPLPRGQSYASWRDGFLDKDALAVVPVPEADFLAWAGRRAGDPAGALDALRRAASRAYADEPAVIRGNAGDCLRLTIVNALTPLGASGPAPDTRAVCGHGPNGDAGPMRDCLGDAPLPRIVPLNVEPGWEGPETEAELAQGPVRMEQTDRIDIRPSARIAFTAPLPMLTRGEKAFLPFGVNLTTSVPVGEAQTGDYYLGLLRVDWEAVDYLFEQPTLPNGFPGNRGLSLCAAMPDFAPALPAERRARALGLFAGADPDFALRAAEEDPGAGGFGFDLLGARRWIAVSRLHQGAPNVPAELVGDLEPMAKACFARLLATPGIAASSAPPPPYAAFAPVHAIPYAFGPVPLKPVADIFNQLPHGLAGVIVVEPKGAAYAGRRVHDTGQGLYEPAPARPAGPAHRGRGANTLVTLPADAVTGEPRAFREFVLVYQDGLNLWDAGSANQWRALDGGRPLPIVHDCRVCDDSYDLGEKAVSYRAPAFDRRLRQMLPARVEAHNDLNAFSFPDDFRDLKDSLSSNPLRLWARPEEEVVIRVVHPGGRARQRAFVTLGNDYDDLFPGFGFPHSALLAPGRAVPAALSAPVRSGCYLWSDGPRLIEAAGAWGLLDVLSEGGASSCGFHP